MTAPSGGGTPPLPLYLGPQLPRWTPRTVGDVQAAIDDGTLAERHWVDVKAVLNPSDGAKKEHARDLVSFANDGGALLLGVAEDTPTRALSMAPVELAGLAERVDQVARSRCDPPLYVVCHPLADPADPTHGVLLIEVPPSPSAPHMAAGRYYGRGDTTRHQLTDAEVARLHAVRSSRQLTAEQVIAGEIARDPIPVGSLSHLFVVAQPLASPPDLLTGLLGTPRLTELLRAATGRVPEGTTWPPHWGYLSAFNEPRADGVGFRTSSLPGRSFAPVLGDLGREEDQLDVEIADSGRLALFCGRASQGLSAEAEQFVVESPIITLTRGLVTLAGDLGGSAGYAGRWLIAVGVTELRGKRSSASFNAYGFGDGLPPFSSERYVQGTEAMTVELVDRPGTVTRRLLGRLLRGLGTGQGQYDSLLADRA